MSYILLNKKFINIKTYYYYSRDDLERVRKRRRLLKGRKYAKTFRENKNKKCESEASKEESNDSKEEKTSSKVRKCFHTIFVQ